MKLPLGVVQIYQYFLYANIIQEGGWVCRENFIADNFYNVEFFVTIYIIRYVFCIIWSFVSI